MVEHGGLLGRDPLPWRTASQRTAPQARRAGEGQEWRHGVTQPSMARPHPAKRPRWGNAGTAKIGGVRPDSAR